MTREQKLALIIGFALVLLVGVLVSDHLSGARASQLADVGAALEESAPPPLPDTAPAEPGTNSRAERPLGAVAAAPEPVTRRPDDEARAMATETTSQSLLRALQEQFETTRQDAPTAAQIDRKPDAEPRELPGETPPVADPLVKDAVAVATHRVEKGDSLWSIAERRYGDGHLAKALGEYNVARGRLRDPDTIRVGATILIPEPRALNRPVLAANQPTTTRAPEPRTYTVRRGDTLGEIAQRQLGSARRVQAILAANESTIDDPDDIRVGMVLRLPS